MYQQFDKIGIQDTNRGLIHDGQLLIPRDMFVYIEEKAWKTHHTFFDENIVNGYDVMVRTRTGYLGVVFFDTDSLDEGWNVHIWISPYYSKMYRMKDGRYFFEGHEGLYDHFGIRRR